MKYWLPFQSNHLLDQNRHQKHLYEQGMLPTSRKETNEDEESLYDIIQEIVKKELAAHEKTIKALINSSLQTTN